MKAHKETFLRFEEIGATYPPYQPNHEFPGEYIDGSHRYFSTLPVNQDEQIRLKDRRWLGRVIEGWLSRDDAGKLYELAYFAPGDILELGTCKGLSTIILAEANRNSPCPKKIVSVDYVDEFLDAARRNLSRRGLLENVELVCEEGAEAVRRLIAERKRFAFVFVDHSHAYEDVHAVCRVLPDAVEPGAFCLFHDYNDPRNPDPQHPDYGVYQAVTDGLPADAFEFYGVYGCSALFRASGA
ncbi:MAG: class I SAM-dependent methyltransferase [Candidatus Eisenbacteria bacterium]